MNLSPRIPPQLGFYASPPHECSYLPQRKAVTLFADPRANMTTTVYGALAEMGFRRSGEYVYRPRCHGCSACLSARVPVSAFDPDRSQRRTLQRNRDLRTKEVAPEYRDDHFALYRAYISSRHEGGGMDTDSRAQYTAFLTSSWCNSHFVEFRLGERLLALSVVDLLQTGFSAVYTFFDPNEKGRGLGNLAILWLIEEARRRHLPYVYLGYYIAECRKMAYKARYRPLEIYCQGIWRELRVDGGSVAIRL